MRGNKNRGTYGDPVVRQTREGVARALERFPSSCMDPTSIFLGG